MTFSVILIGGHTMRKKLVEPGKPGATFDPKTQPGYKSRFGNFAFNSFFGDVNMTKTKDTENSESPIANQKVQSDESFYGSRQLDQVIPSRAYKKGKTP